MKRKPTIKNSEKIWKLEYLEPNFHQEPDDQNKVNEDLDEGKQTKSKNHSKNQWLLGFLVFSLLIIFKTYRK